MKLFRKLIKEKVPSLDQNLLLIMQIHKDFFEQHQIIKNEYPTFLEQKKQQRVTYSTDQEKYDKLVALGLGQSKPAQLLEQQKRDQVALSQMIDQIESIISTQKKYEEIYPQYKFITETQVNKLCKKYNLECHPILTYIGEIPEQNIEDIANCQIQSMHKETIWLDGHITVPQSFAGQNRSSRYVETFEICAPAHDFKKITPSALNDPIVLQRVKCLYFKGYLIVTAWGPEALDPLIQKS